MGRNMGLASDVHYKKLPQSRTPCEDRTKIRRVSIIGHYASYFARMTPQSLKYRDRISHLHHSVNLRTYNLRKKPPAPTPPGPQPYPLIPPETSLKPHSTSLRQPQRILRTLLIPRRFSNSVRHSARSILDRATSALCGVANGISRAFGGVAGCFANAGDCEGLEEGRHG